MKYVQEPGKTPAFMGVYQEVVSNSETDELNFCTIGFGDETLPPTNHAKSMWMCITLNSIDIKHS